MAQGFERGCHHCHHYFAKIYPLRTRLLFLDDKKEEKPKREKKWW
jgi:hypothetical protein